MPVSFEAEVTARGNAQFRVNHPLRLDGANVYLLGHGYAPILKYTDAAGKSQTTVSPFLPTDGMLTSEGVAAFPDANGSDKAKQMGFEGLYLPTAGMGRSNHPEERDPALMLLAYRGDLGLDAGVTGSVYELNKERLTRLGDANDAQAKRAATRGRLTMAASLNSLVPDNG